MTDKP